mmetsp:Transcript_25969/g.83887  ORF Transcript_25969/g.83887 Transcript_25969/m.83887 type:complete len:282 (+) Transcript_25969:1251-2096(+)
MGAASLCHVWIPCGLAILGRVGSGLLPNCTGNNCGTGHPALDKRVHRLLQARDGQTGRSKLCGGPVAWHKPDLLVQTPALLLHCGHRAVVLEEAERRRTGNALRGTSDFSQRPDALPLTLRFTAALLLGDSTLAISCFFSIYVLFLVHVALVAAAVLHILLIFLVLGLVLVILLLFLAEVGRRRPFRFVHTSLCLRTTGCGCCHGLGGSLHIRFGQGRSRLREVLTHPTLTTLPKAAHCFAYLHRRDCGSHKINATQVGLRLVARYQGDCRLPCLLERISC